MGHVPVVFISSTSEDLREHREQAAKAAQANGFFPLMMEYFAPNGQTPSLPACLEKVAEAEVVIVLVAHRYGWVPDNPANTAHKSITWLECEHAKNVTKKEVLAFIVDSKHDWPLDLREDYRLIKERKRPGIAEEVERNEKKLAEFKSELSQYFRASFTDAASVRALVGEALNEWRKRHPSAAIAAPPGDPERYLAYLEDDTRQIRIKGLKSKRAEPYFFGIEEIYIPLTTLAGHEDLREMRQRRTVLERALNERKLVIIGAPGSGKSTFLRRTAFELCRNIRGTRPTGATPFLAPDDQRFPILIRVAELAKLLAAEEHSAKAPPDWLPYFLGKQSEAYTWKLNEAFFRRRLDEGNCLIMMDGLDEAPNRRLRERLARIFEQATQAFGKCDFLVSTREQSYEGDGVLEGFQRLRIGELEPPEIRTFFQHFARALALNDDEAQKFKGGLELALTSRFEIRDMARNPVMLTALAVLQHNDQRLPEHRVDLYESILGWLAAARENAQDRPAEQCLKQMRKLALHMQDAPGGRLVQINKRNAAELASQTFGGTVDANEEMLERETQDSGIISSLGADLKFWHLSFQEYLAAREIAGLTEQQQIDKVVSSGKPYQPEWREVMRLLGGVLFKQGEPKIEGLFVAILGQIKDPPKLADQARCAALLGAMMRDLKGMGYTPKSPGYEKTVKAVERIFDAGEADKIDIKTRIEAADALGQVGDARLEEDNWVPIPAGTFLMGAQNGNKNGPNYDAKASDREAPVHEVHLKSYRIGRFPVTVQEFGEFIKDGGYKIEKHWAAGGFGQFTEAEYWAEQQQYPNRPVVSVSWFEASAYCAWKGGRLPTEAEWERAARGPRSSRYPWGDEPPLDSSRANYEEKIGHATPVGVYPKGNSAEGLCEMLGNVWEWCSDWYAPYEKRAGSGDEEYKVLRGGSWINYSLNVRVSLRSRNEPSYRNDIIGFRCARE